MTLAAFCSTCGLPTWHLKGTDVDTCRRGHHQLCEPSECPDRRVIVRNEYGVDFDVSRG